MLNIAFTYSGQYYNQATSVATIVIQKKLEHFAAKKICVSL